MNRRAWQAVVGGGLVTVCAAVAAVVAAQTGSPGSVAGQPGAAQAGAAGHPADPASLTGGTTRLIVPDVIASVPGGVS